MNELKLKEMVLLLLKGFSFWIRGTRCFANSEDPDVHEVAFHQGLLCLLR